MPGFNLLAGLEILTADRTYYVRTDGNDANGGLGNTSSSAFLTIQRAVDEAANKFFGPYKTTIRIADGVYPGYVFITNATVGATSSSALALVGNDANPAAVVIKYVGISATSVSLSGVTIQRVLSSFSPCYVDVSFCRIASTQISDSSTMYFSDCSVWTGSPVNSYGRAFYATNKGYMTLYNITVEAGVVLGQGFAVSENAQIDVYNSPTGSSIGKKFNATINGIINTYGGGVNFLPGSVAGDTATGGQYV